MQATRAVSQQHVWLRRVLLAKVALCFFLWGLPTLFASAATMEPMGMSMPADPFPMRLLGVLFLVLGVAYWYGYRDPVRNVAIVKVGVVDNGLVAVLVLFLGVTGGVPAFVWFSGILGALFCAAFLRLMPKE